MFEAVHGVHMDQSTKSTAESPDAELPSTMIPKRALETVAEKKKKTQVLALLSLWLSTSASGDCDCGPGEQ